MAAPHNVEFEAAKFLQKLIHESTDEPAKLATKLYVILQHMKASGKENSMPYQVISRAMETVINHHGLDIEALMSSRVSLSTEPHPGEGARAQAAGCSQPVGAFTDSISGMTENDTSRTDGFTSGRPPAAPSSTGHDPLQGCTSQRSTRSFDQESPSSMDTRSANSHSHDRRETAGWEQQGSERDPKKASIKRKRPEISAVEPQMNSSQQPDAHTGVPDMRKERFVDKGEMPGTFPGTSIDPKAGKGPVDSEYWKQGFIKSAAPNFRERVVPGHMVSPNQGDVATASTNSASRLDAAGISHMPMNVDRLLQGGNPSNVGETGRLRSAASRDMGKSPVTQASVTGMPFKEHHLKQLRAQCLVFLAFRNGLPPKRLHLEIALGNILPKEGLSGCVDGAQNEPMADKGKQQTTPEASCATEVTSLQGNLAAVTKNEGGGGSSVPTRSVTEADIISKETENSRLMEMKSGPLTDASLVDEETKHLKGRGIMEAELPSQAGGASDVACATVVNKQLKPETIRWTGAAHNDPSWSLLPASMQYDLGNRNEISLLPQHDSSTQIQQHADNRLSTSWKAFNGIDSEYHRQVAANGANMLLRSTSHDVEEEDTGFAPSPKYTLSEQWTMAHHKKKLATEQKWMQKVQQADERIFARFNELKETVSSSEDISAKTRSVIELKKLQLLELQRRLRSNILNDFFKPVQKEMDQLKSIKKHRIGRRLKHVEKYEQKMKEERQRRIRERQKEFFSEVEAHRERLEDVFKFKRERCKGFNRYVKEYHKKRERIHREKIDRIQREKINLLKVNDVEGYLRMVQDAKSDRVKQLLKETEKYLLKLGSKLKEAKSVARQAEMDGSGIAIVDDTTEIALETEDESDQAKHYLESNEKYYTIAHSVKENIAEQPSGLVGGKLREYQMNGLRWLVSLYNNHLNGILADEMGLGKTVQVISLLCYLMEAKNDRGPFLVVVPSSVLPGWEQEMSFWAPGINKIVYAGAPEDRRRLFKENIIHQKFNVLLTTYEYLMNKHDRPKLSKINWHYVIIDEGHRIKNASCKLNADLKHYHSAHRLLLTGTPLQNNLEELWALLNFLLPNIFNSSDDFSQWFNKPFESSVDNSADEALLSEEENLLIINRLHQVLRPFVLRRLKHKVENELPEKIERLVRCEASAYQKLLIKRVEDNLGALGVHKARSVHNSVMELRNICNHPYLSHLHSEQVDNLIPKHYLPPVVRLCGKVEMLDRLLPKLKATNHRVLLFSTMTRLLDVMEEYLVWKKYRYLRLDGHTSGQDRGALIDAFNRPDSPFFIFLLSIRAGGVGVNLQAADTVIIFDTDWNPQVDLQAQARAHRIGQKKDVLVLRLETVHTVEEQVRAAAEYKLGVANQSITAGFFDNNTSAEDRREYLESLLRESKKEEAAPVLDDDGLNDILARSESEIDVFEAIDQKRREEEMATWKRVVSEKGNGSSEDLPPLPSRLLTDDDLNAFCEAMKIYEVSATEGSSGMKRKGGYPGGLDTQVYGRGKRAREVRSYEEQWTEDEFEKMCKADSPETAAKAKEELMDVWQPPNSSQTASDIETPTPQALPPALLASPLVKAEVTPSPPPPPPVKRGRGRPRRTPSVDASSSPGVHSPSIAVTKPEVQKLTTTSIVENPTGPDSQHAPAVPNDVIGVSHHGDVVVTTPSSQAVSPLPSSLDPGVQSTPSSTSVTQPKRQGRKGRSIEKNIQEQSGSEPVRRRGRKPSRVLSSIASGPVVQDPKPDDQPAKQPSSETCAPVIEEGAPPAGTEPCNSNAMPLGQIASIEESGGGMGVQDPNAIGKSKKQTPSDTSAVIRKDLLSQGQSASVPESSASLVVGSIPSVVTESPIPGSTGLRRGRKLSEKLQSETEPPRRRGRKRRQTVSSAPETPVVQDPNTNGQLKSTPSTVTTTVTYFAEVSGLMHQASAGSVPNVPATSQSSPLPSGTPDIPSDIPQIPVTSQQAQRESQEGPVGEALPRRRGRRKSIVSAAGPDNLRVQNMISRQSDAKRVEIAERKVIATRSRKMSIAQSKNAQQEARKGDTSGILVSRDSNTAVPTIGQLGDLHLAPSQSTFGSPTVSTNELGKFPESRQVTPANLPPITSTGVTNVIVLALESTAPALGSTGISCRAPRLLASKADNVTQLSCTPGTAILEEEMSAPPGFDTPRTSSLDVSAKKSLESVEAEVSKAPDAKTGSVVLGLESAAANVDPCSVTSQNKTERDESLELLCKKTVQGSEHPSKPQGSQQKVKSAPGMRAAVQPEEDMLAPPGFDIPQQSLPETAVVISLQRDDSQERKNISVCIKATNVSMGGTNFEKTQEDVHNDSSESSVPLRSSTLALQNECMDSRDDHLSAVASGSGEKINESSDHVEEDPLPPGNTSPEAPLLQDKNSKPYESRESHVPAESVPSKGANDSEYEHMEREIHDNIQSVKATSVADIAMVESEEKLAIVDNLNTQKDESCGVGIGEGRQCLGASVSKFDNEKGSINVALISEVIAGPSQVNDETTGNIDCGQTDCTSSEVQLGDDNKSVSTPEMAEKPPEGVINITVPIIESPLSPACLNDKLSKEEGNAKDEDACQEDGGAREKQADPLMKEADADASIKETNTMPASVSNETIEKPQPEKSPTVGLVSEPLDDASTTLSDETQAVANLMEKTDCATSIKESVTMPASKNDDEIIDKTQPEHPTAVGSVCKPVDDVNTEHQDEEQADGAHAIKGGTVSAVSHPIKEADVASSIEKSITVPTSVNSKEAEETQPEKPPALESVSEPGDNVNASCVMSTECLKCPEENDEIGDACEKDDTACAMDTDSCNSIADSTRSMDNHPKENVKVGDLCEKGDVGCEMDIDSDNVAADVTAPTNDTTLSTPDPCNEGSAQDLLLARSSETVTVRSIESDVAFGEGKDGPSHGEEDDSAGGASLVEASDVHAISVIKSTPGAKAKGFIDDSLTESKEQVEQNVGTGAENQKCSVSCDQQQAVDVVMDATLSFESTPPEEVNADTATLANMGESGKQVDESKRVADVDHDGSSSCNVHQAVEGEEAKRATNVDHKGCSPCDDDQAVKGEVAKGPPDLDVECEDAKRAPDVDQKDCSLCDVHQAVGVEEAERALDVDIEGEEAKRAQDVDQKDCIPCDILQAVKGEQAERPANVDQKEGRSCDVQLVLEGGGDVPIISQHHSVEEVAPCEASSEDLENAQENAGTLNDHLSAVGLDSGDKVKHSNDLVGEDSVIPEFAKTSLLQDRNDKPSESRMSHIPVESEPSKDPAETCDHMQTLETTAVADVPMVESRDKLAEGDKLIIRKDQSSVIDTGRKGEFCREGSVLKLDDEKDSTNVDAISEDVPEPREANNETADGIDCGQEDCSPSEVQLSGDSTSVNTIELAEKSSEDVSHLMEPVIEGPSGPASVDSKTSDEVEPEKLSAVTLTLDPEGVGKIKPSYIADTSTEEFRSPKENAKDRDACQDDDGACETMDKSIDDASSIEKSITLPASISNETIEENQPENPPVLGSVLAPGDDANTRLAADENIKIGDACREDDMATEMDVDSHILMADPIKSVDSSVEIVKVGDACQKDNVGCEMDIDAHDLMTDATEAYNSSALSTPDVCNDGSTQDFLSAGNNEAVTKGSTESCMVLGDEGKDGASHETQNYSSGSQSASSVEASLVQAVSAVKCTLEEKDKERVHAGDGVPCTSKPANSDDGKTRDPGSDVAEAKEQVAGNGNDSSAIPDAVHAGDSLPSTSKLGNSDDEAVHAGVSVPNTSRLENSDDGNSGNNVAEAMDEDEVNVDDGSSEIPDAVHGGDSAPSTSKPDNSNDEGGKKDDNYSDILDDVHAGDSVPSISKLDNSDDVESREAGSNVTKKMEQVEGDGDDCSSNILDGVHGGDIVPSTSKPNDSDDEAGQKDDSHSDQPEAVHAGDSAPCTSEPENFNDAKTRDSVSNVTRAVEQLEGNGDDVSSGIPDGVHAGDTVPSTAKPDDFDDETGEKDDSCSETPDAVHDGENIPSSSMLDNSDGDEMKVSGINVDQPKVQVEGYGDEGVPSTSNPESTDIKTNDSSTCVTEVRDEVEENVGATDVSDVVHGGDSVIPTTQLENPNDANKKDPGIGDTKATEEVEENVGVTDVSDIVHAGDSAIPTTELENSDDVNKKDSGIGGTEVTDQAD